MATEPPPRSRHALTFLALGRSIRIECSHAALRGYFEVNFGAMAAPLRDTTPGLDYRIESRAPGSYSLDRNGVQVCTVANPDELVFLLEQDLTVELQKQRSDLYFLHSASIERDGKACLLAAESGSGKSTTTWGLLHHGFRYLSDELSPIDLSTLRVVPYPHALCLKQEPPPAYALPAAAIRVGRRINIPTHALPGATVSWPCAIGAVFLVKHRPGLAAPEMRAVTRAEASAHLYVTALNALAHPSHGLDAVVRIAEQAPCFAVESADLEATCKLIGSTFDDVVGGRVEATRS